MIIVLEGLDATGKSTHAKLLSKALGGAKVLKFPDRSTHIGGLIDKHLRNEWSVVCPRCEVTGYGGLLAKDKPIDAYVFQCLQIVNRLECWSELQAAAKSPEPVLVDRYWQSAVAYGGADGADQAWLIQVHSPLPHAELNILLDMDPEIAMQRRSEKRDRYENAGTAYMTKVRDNYLQLWRQPPPIGYWMVIDVNRPKDVVAEELFKLTRQHPLQGC